MGKIVKNGVTYSGSSDNADNVKYNNNVSNLDATNVQEAIDKLDESVDILNSNLTQVQSQIVPTSSIESGAFASKAYNAGDFLVKNGSLWKATTDISKDDALTPANIVPTTVGGELSSARSNSFAIKEVLHVASTTTTATDYTTEPLDDYNFFIVSCGVLGFREYGYLYDGSVTGFYSKAELLDTSNYSIGAQLKVYDIDGAQGARTTVIKYVNNTTIKLFYKGSYPTEVRI